MSDLKTYSDHSYDLLMGDKHRIIKSVLRQIFEGIYKEIQKNCYFEQKSRDLITDFMQWPDDHKWDFNATAGMFNSLLFKNKTFDRAANQEKKGILFSIGDVEGKIQSSKYNVKLVDLRRLNKQLEVKKNFSFGFKKMTEIGAICRELMRMRNLLAHNNGLNNPTQALILLSNSLRLVEMTPDPIRETTMNFEYLEKFIENDFLDSILSLKRPDIDDEIEDLKQKLKDKNKNNKDSEKRELHERLESINEQLNGLKELNNISNNLSDNQISVNEILNLVKNSNLKTKKINQNTSEFSEESNVKKDSLIAKGDLSRSEVYNKLMELRLKIKKELSPIYSGFRKEHNLLDEPLAKVILAEKLITVNDLKSNVTFKMKIKINKNNNKQPINKNTNEDYMEMQIKKYWPDAQLILEEYFKK